MLIEAVWNSPSLLLQMPKNVIQIELDTTGDVSGVRRVGTEYDKLEKKSGKAAKKMGKNFEASFRSMQRSGAIAFAAVSASIGLAIKAASDFEYGMAKVSTMFAGPATAALAQYEAKLKALATIPTTENIRGMQDALYQILSASVEVSKATDVLELSLKAAAAGFTTTEIAADTITSVLNAYNMSVEEATRVSDILFTAQMRGKTTFGEMGMALGQVLGSAAAAGVEFEEIAASLATLTARGIPTRQAVTALNMAIVTFIKPTKQAKDVLKEFGIEINLARMQEIGFTRYLEEVTSALGGNISKVAEATGSVEALKAIVNLTGQNFQSAVGNVDAMTDALGATEEAYDKMADTFQLQSQALVNSVSELRREIGETFLPILKDVTDNLVIVVTKLSDYSDKHPEVIRNVGGLIVALASLLAIVGTAGRIIPWLAVGISNVGSAAAAVVKFLYPLGISIGVGGVAVKVAVLAWKDFAAAITGPADAANQMAHLMEAYGLEATEAAWAYDRITQAMAGGLTTWEGVFEGTKDLVGENWNLHDALLEVIRDYETLAPLIIQIPGEEIRPAGEPFPGAAAAAEPPPTVAFGVGFAAEQFAQGVADRENQLFEHYQTGQQLHWDYLKTLTGMEMLSASEREEIWRNSLDIARNELQAYEAAWMTATSSITDLHMTGHQRMMAITKSFVDAAIGQIAREMWAHITMERAKQIATKQGIVVEAAAAAQSIAQAGAVALAWIKTAFMKLTAFYGFLGPFAPVAAGVTVAAAIATMRALVLHQGGQVQRYQTGGLAGNELLAILEEGEFVVRREAAVPNMELLEALNAAPERGTALAPLPTGGTVPIAGAASIFGKPTGGDTYIFNLPDETRDETVDFIRSDVLPAHSKEQLRRRMQRP